MDITPEVIEALRTLRDLAANSEEVSHQAARAFNTLDNAGVFKAIDAGACTCPPTVLEVLKDHGVACPSYSATTAVLNFTESMVRR